ncbi:biotin--[acetyl-CoA-carboxylase] ligase [Croceicoccus estronivorus]|uniref:biotin--[acetyl-CoA-carboxylase] ligase n=1 Tax=Croceicoccus estronivorus TaxID=1172626 RepID=UPI0008336368|nr:biotin--[acetyl-CoA-carboxylase] ligase [Croceicoccus estronivorus]OCC23189.1 biotin--[acetyl-CoA-carboxylase] ligase [Croceicoccus estronivorus]
MPPLRCSLPLELGTGIEFVAETGSTNADIVTRLRNGDLLPEGYWLVADRQTEGRGRQGRTWFDGMGNFMGSSLVHRQPSDPSAPSLALMAGLAVWDAVSRCIPDPSCMMLKWPNDVLLGRAKLAGILLEAVEQAVIVGIGVNLAMAPDLPDRPATALSSIGPAPDRDVFATTLANSFAAELARWRQYGLEPLMSRWQSIAHPLGTPLTLRLPGTTVPLMGSYAGLDRDGALLLQLADGSVRVVHAGDVFV